MFSLCIPITGDMYYFNNYASTGYSLSNFNMNNAYNISIVYAYFYDIQNSIFVGNSLSIIGYTFAMIFLSKLMDIFSFSPVKKVYTLLITSMIPISIYYQSSVLRESWMLCFFIVAIYCLLMHYSTNNKKYIILSLFFAFLLTTLHFKSAVFYLLFIYIFYLIFFLGKYIKIDVACLILLFVVITIFSVISLDYLLDFISNDKSINIYDFLSNHMHKNVLYQLEVETSTSYVVISDVNADPIVLMVKNYFRYLFAPYPTDMFNKDIVSICFGILGILRLYMFVAILVAWKNSVGVLRKEHRVLMYLLLISLISVTFVFSLGTGNFGTAIRHWDLSWWILCLLFVYTRKKIICLKK